MDESIEKMSTSHGKKLLNPFAVKKPKKRSLVERELETNMTARITSPVTVVDGVNTSRYGRARQMKYKGDSRNLSLETLKSPKSENTPLKVQTPKTKPIINSPFKTETPKKTLKMSVDNIDNLYQASKSLNHLEFNEVLSKSPSTKNLPKVYIRKDLIQNRDDDDDDDVILIKDLFSPNSGKKRKMLQNSEKSHSTKQQNGFIDNASVVKALDFDDANKGVGNKRDSDGNKRKRENKGKKSVPNEQFQVEATCPYQVGDLAWARMGTFPFWPCIITRDPACDMFVRKKLFGRVEHYILHVTFFADNGRRSWVVDNMLRKYMGPLEFLSTREKFTPEDKKKDSRLYAAFFISEKKQSLWDTSVEEAEMINHEPKRLRLDIFNDILLKARASKKQQKSGKITRTDSDVSLSESLYDSLFSEDDSKTDDSNRSRNKSRNKSLDVSDVVTACLDNMAAKTGNIKIQRQSHMDRWLQKAKSKTPEKVKTQIELKTPVITPKIEINITPVDDGLTLKVKNVAAPKVEKPVTNSKKKKLPAKEVKITKIYSLRRSYESQNALMKPPENKELKPENDLNCTKNVLKRNSTAVDESNTIDLDSVNVDSIDCNGIIPKNEPLAHSNKEIIAQGISKNNSNAKIEVLGENSKINENSDDVLNAINELLEDTYSKTEYTNKGSPKRTEIDKQVENKVIKPEVMDVDEYQENKVQDQSALITENLVILDSPVKIEKESSIKENLENGGSPAKIGKVLSVNDGDRSLVIEKESSIEATPVTTPDLKDKQSHEAIEISSEMSNISNASHKTSPTLNRNEIVSISENSKMTDGESNSLTSLEESIPKTMALEDHNSNLTNKDEINADMNTTRKQDISIEKHVIPIENSYVSIKKKGMPIDDITEEDIQLSERDLLNQSGDSESILDACQTEELINNIENSSETDKASSNNTKTNPFLDDSRNIDCVFSATVNKEVFFREVNMNKPPDLTFDKDAKADLLLNKESDYDEDSDDEPSPEYEPLGEEITEDFRQHLMCIESSITNKKDDAQLVKVCNEIAIIEESKTKLVDIISSVSQTSPNKSVEVKILSSMNKPTQIVKENIKTELSLSENIIVESAQDIEIAKEQITVISLAKISNNTEVKRENVVNEETLKINLTENTGKDISKDVKAEILDGLNIIKKSVENSLKSPPSIKKHKLSLKKESSRLADTIIDVAAQPIVINDNTVNPRYKTIDQIEEIMKNKPKRLPIENDEVRIPEIKENGYKIEIDTPEIEDDDFDIDNVSVNSEDSEVSLPQNKAPARRSLRSRPEKKGGLEDPEFLTYMELRQDDLMEEHPELTRDDIVLYLYKTYAYAQNLKSDVKLEESPLVKSIKEESPPASRKKVKKPQIQPKNTIENYFREKYKNAKKIDFEECESAGTSDSNEDIKPIREICSISPVDSGIGNSNESNTSVSKRKTKPKSPTIDLTTDFTKDFKVELRDDITKQEDTCSPRTPKRIRKKTISPRVAEKYKISPSCIEKSMDKRVPIVVISPIKDNRFEIKNRHSTEMKLEIFDETKHGSVAETKLEQDTETESNERVAATKHEQDTETESIDSDSELPLRHLRSKVLGKNKLNELKKDISELKDEIEETASVSSDNEPLLRLRPKKDKSNEGTYEDPEFLKYQELKQDAIMDDNPQLSLNEIKAYLYKTWIYEKDSKSEIQKIDEIESSNLVKGVSQESAAPQRKVKRRPKTEKNIDLNEFILKEKPKRKTISHYYNEAFISDIEDELEIFEIFKTKKTPITVVSKLDSPKKDALNTETKTEGALKNEVEEISEEINSLDEIELYFKQLTSPKPSVFKGLIREKVCEICEDISNLIKCKGCNGTFHYDCVNKVVKTVEAPVVFRGRKKKKKPVGRRHKNLDDSENSDERSQDVSEDNISMEESESLTIDAATLESQLEAKMKEILDKETQLNYDSYSSDDGVDWTETVPGKCELVDVKLKRRDPPIDTSNFKCINCQKYDTPVCFVCKSAVSKTDVKIRQKCNFAHCHNFYHLECLDHWPQTQFNAGEWTRNKKTIEQLEALTCPRHVCHTCVSDDPRGCKTRFSGDKLARCVRCPATYHSFNKCLPAGTQILTASLIICPRHYEHRPGKVPCHVNTGWCFICALGGSLICCEYCPTSFHAECLNIKPPEGNYMCEDCETGRLPLYGEMVWVKLGHYRWWPGVILHPSEIPDNIMAVKHGLGEFVVRFFGQYDHYWVNRGRVFPYQEGDSGRVSGQKSKIDAAFTTAIEHAQRAFEILKTAEPDEEESIDIASSLLPPHYVKLKCNKPIGSLLGRKIEDPSLSLTQCECNPSDAEPCGPNSQCLNRVLLTECGPTCRAGERCNNRAFEKRLYPKLTPYRATHRGWGLKTLEDIKAGQFVIEYVGELIDEEEFQRRMRRKHEIRDENFYFLILDKERMIDAGPKGNLARFMNHCCEPNCETQKWTVLGDVRVGLFAIDDIKANSEVTFNYNLECTGIEKKRCLCGAKRCSGYIGAKPKQLDESQRKKNCSITGKRKYTKRKNIEESPSTSKNKTKRPLGRPPKPKELTEIEKDLMIIKSAVTVSSDDSRCPSLEDKSTRTLKNKLDSNTTEEGTVSNETEHLENNSKTLINKDPNLIGDAKTLTEQKDLDCNPTKDEPILNGTEPQEQSKGIKKKLDCNLAKEVPSKETSKSLKRKLGSNSTEEVILSSAEPSAKRLKCDTPIEVGD